MTVRKVKKMSFNELVNENKRALLNDAEAIERIEARLDEKHYKRLKENC